MRLGLINSAFAQAGKGTRFGLEQTKRLGFDSVDLLADPLDMTAAERRLIADTCRELDLPIESSQSNEALLFEAFTGRVPPRGTEVDILLSAAK